MNDIFHSRTEVTGARNIFNYSNPEVDKLLTEFEDTRREIAKDAYHKLCGTCQGLPYLFLWKLDTSLLGERKYETILLHLTTTSLL